MEVRGLVWKKGRKKYKLLMSMHQKIEGLVKERRQLRKQWKRADQSQKEGLSLLQRAIKISVRHYAELSVQGNEGLCLSRYCALQ